MKDKKKLTVRNSTAEFLIFNRQAGQDSVEIRFDKETIWLSQKMMSILFDCSTDNVSLHLKNIFNENELEESSVTEEFSATGSDGKNYRIKHYSLDAVISVGYRVNSKKATEFRKWATRVLNEFSQKGYVLDKERLKNGAFFNEDYFDKLLEDIREIRISERKFYQKITDIYTTALDYDPLNDISKEFFATVQNKIHFSIHGETAAELIYKRVDSKKDYMGLTSWENSPDGKIRKSDVVVAKNYLNEEEIKALQLIVSFYLDFAELQALNGIPMSMADWIVKLDDFLKLSNRNILKTAGKISHDMAIKHAETEFEKYRIVQDKLFNSDFDKLINDELKKLK